MIAHLGLLLALSHHAFSFSFNTSTPTQCGQLTIQWDGGEGPFQFLLVPTIEVANGHIQNVTIPGEQTEPYSYTFNLEQPAGLEFLATMYDSTGFGSGGTTPVLTVGSSDNTDCLRTELLYDFTFQLSPDSNPAQCSSQTITWQNNVTRPVNLFGLIPGGTAWRIPIPQDGTTYDWQVNIAEGTEYLLTMSDTGPYITGGSSSLIRVASGTDTCMNDTSPRAGGNSGTGSATPSTSGVGPSASVSGVGGGSSGGTSGGNDPQRDNNGGGGGGGSKTGAIVGGTIGGIAFLVLLVLLLFFCIRRRARQRNDSTDPIIRSYGANGAQTTEKRRTGTMDLFAGRGGRAERALSDDSTVETAMRGDDYQPSPFRYPDSTQAPGMTGGAAGATTGAGVGAGLGATGVGASGVRNSGEKAGTPIAAAMMANSAANTRPSFESSNNTATANNTPPTSTPPGGNTGAGAVPPPAVSSTGRTDAATVGHGVTRNSSIAKHGLHGVSGQSAAGTALAGGGVAGAAGGDGGAGGEGGGEGRRLPDTPTQGGTRFVQHEDSGEVVYDQLRTRNPDTA